MLESKKGIIELKSFLCGTHPDLYLCRLGPRFFANCTEARGNVVWQQKNSSIDNCCQLAATCKAHLHLH